MLYKEGVALWIIDRFLYFMKNLFYKKAIFLLIAITGGVILSALSYFVSGSKTPISQVHADAPAGSSSSGSSSGADCDVGGSGSSGDC